MWTFSDLGFLSRFVQTLSQSKKNAVSVFDTKDERLSGLEYLTEKKHNLNVETHVLPLFSQKKYLFFAFNAETAATSRISNQSRSLCNKGTITKH